MSNDSKLKTIITSEQLQKRVKDLGRKISDDYTGKMLHVVCVLENGFLFTADLIRSLDCQVLCHFVKAFTREKIENNINTLEIFFSPETNVSGHDVLLVEGIIQSGLTTEFLIRNMLSRGATSVKVATLLDRQSKRSVSLQPDYFGFLIDENFVVGYGLGGPDDLNRNLSYVATAHVVPGAAH